jgi:transaldolase/fructose-6-phosphate aldolase-like protein
MGGWPVSTEVDPRIVYDTDRTIAEARALWRLVDRPNLLIKIPAAKQGLPAITACPAEGISINVTLIFSLARYAGVRRGHAVTSPSGMKERPSRPHGDHPEVADEHRDDLRASFRCP